MKINCHCHIFSLDCVPLAFRQRFLLDVRNPFHKLMRRLVDHVLPQDSKVEEWLGMADLSIREIADTLVVEMDEAGIDLCTPLMMDMAYCKAFGGNLKPFEEQLAETIAAVTAVNDRYQKSRMWPFVAADPHRENVVDVVTNALEGGIFKGVKIYPVMGFTPDDRRLYPIYDYCVQREVPITTHCQNGGIPGLEGYYRLAHPKYWKRVLSAFPELVLNLAHNDWTGTSWQRGIRQLILDYPNVYTDVAYDTEMWLMPRRYFKSIQKMLHTAKIQDRLLFGTDWYMGRFLWTEASYLEWFTRHAAKIPWCRVKFTPMDMHRLTDANPRRFLGLAKSRVPGKPRTGADGGG